MNREEKQTLCVCGHKRAAHFGKDHLEDCSSPIEGTGFCFCSCKHFREGKFNSEEEIEMAKKNSGKKAERQPRTQLVYVFNVEKARELRDGSYKEKDNLVATVLRVLCANHKEGYTFDQMAERVKAETGKLPTRAQFPLNKLKGEKVLKPSKERAASAAPKPKVVRKRKPKSSSEAAAPEQAVAAAD